MKKTLPFISLTLVSFVFLLIIGCTSAATPGASSVPEIMVDNKPLTLAEVEKVSGLKVSQPSYLPAGVSFDFATYQQTPFPAVTSQFKLIHEEYGDMGRFLQIIQEAQETAPASALSCGEDTEGCDVIQVAGIPIVYRLHTTETEGVTTEGLDWYKDGFYYRLLRTAGEPNKTYQAELIKVAASMQ